MSADAGNRQSLRRESRHPPPRHGGRGLPEIGGLHLPTPPPQSDPDRAAVLGCKLEATGSRHRQSRHLSDDRSQTAVPQTLLHAGEHRRLVARLDVDHAIGGQTGLSEGRREEVGSGDAPEHLTLGTGCYPGAEERGGGTIDGSISTAGHLVERA